MKGLDARPILLALVAVSAAVADDREAASDNRLAVDIEVLEGVGGCRYRLFGFVVEHGFLNARFHNGCGEPAVFNLCLRNEDGSRSNRAKWVEGNRAADLGLGHEATIPSQRVRWTVDEPACPTPEDAAVGGPSSRARQPDRLVVTDVREILQ